jgi:hypothetical protein
LTPTRCATASAWLAARPAPDPVAQVIAIDGETNEINAFALQVDRIDITQAIVTADPCTPAPPCRLSHRPHTQYLLTVTRT